MKRRYSAITYHTCRPRETNHHATMNIGTGGTRKPVPLNIEHLDSRLGLKVASGLVVQDASGFTGAVTRAAGRTLNARRVRRVFTGSVPQIRTYHRSTTYVHAYLRDSARLQCNSIHITVVSPGGPKWRVASGSILQPQPLTPLNTEWDVFISGVGLLKS